MRSRRQWLHLGPVRFRMPGLVRVTLAETAAGGARRTQRVDVRMTAPVLGEVFRYAGIRFARTSRQQFGSADGTTSLTK